MLCLMSHLGIVAWKKQFALRETEVYFRVAFVYYLYISLIKILMTILLFWNVEKLKFTVRYISEIILNVYIFLPVIKRYIDYTKDRMEEVALREEAEEIIQELREQKNAKR